MMWARSASICRRWRRHGSVARFLSSGRVPQTEDVSLEDITSSNPNPNPNTTSATTESSSLFGIAPRKLRNVEDDEDFVSPPLPAGSSSSPTETVSSSQQNYFSQAWAAQKHRTLGGKNPSPGPGHIEDQLIQPGSQPSVASPLHGWSQSRVWLTAPDLQVSPFEGTFTFVSYKVLASANVSRHRGQLYGHVPNQILEWRTRKRKLLSELELCSPDIICLQEVDRFNDLKSDLALKGYTGVYKVRTGASPDGCAIFWRHERFQLLHEESLEFSETGMRDNIAQFCILQSVLPGSSSTVDALDHRISDVKRRSVIVGNINVLFNPRRGDIKLGQCRVFLDQAHKLMNSWPGAPLVIGGCFNCTPESPIYDYLARSELDISGLDRRYISGQLPKPTSSTSKLGSEAEKSGNVSLRESLAALDGEDSSRSLGVRLKTSLTARFSAQQDKNIEGFANTAKDILKGNPDASAPDKQDDSISGISNVEKQHENRDSGLNKFVSRTIEILENSVNTEQDSINPRKSQDRVSVDQDHTEVKGGTVTEIAEKTNVSIGQSSSENVDHYSSTDKADKVSSKSGLPKVPDANLSIESAKPEFAWESEELKVATGSPDSRVVQHKLKLRSVYPEIQGRADTRDRKGEPLLTMYHRQFRGTVDYIWRSDGLKTTKVLDTVPLKAMLVTPGLPSVVHGSDHVALACELSFTPS